MTKDAEKLLHCIYGIYSQRKNTENRDEAKTMTEEEIADKCKTVFNSEDIYDLILELKENGYVKMDIEGNIYLQNNAIEKIENLPKEEFKKIINFILNLFPVLPFGK